MRSLLAGLLSAALSLPVHAQTTEAYFTTYPTLSPDGRTVVFSFEGDLWKADVQNPQAVRLTAMQGNENTSQNIARREMGGIYRVPVRECGHFPDAAAGR